MNSLQSMKMLFLEDNKTFAEYTISFFELYVHSVIHVTNMEDALEYFLNEKVDIIISDLKVEDGIAIHFIEKIRDTNQDIPIVVLSAHKDEEFLLQAIPLGLISYEIKPINFANFKNVLHKCAQKINSTLLFVKNDIYYNPNKKYLLKGEQEVLLSKKESLFVELLIENKNTIITKDDISNFIWENEIMSDSALKNFLLRIRKKVGKDLFYTIQNVGYRL